MTKDKLYKKLIGYGSLNQATVNSILDPFFESNVCIPKGENRHPCADVYHAWAEDTTQQVQYYDSIWLNTRYLDSSFDLRIKPSEPVYEWQWETQIGKVKTTFDYMTDEEALAFEHETSFYGIKRKQETQRERK